MFGRIEIYSCHGAICKNKIVVGIHTDYKPHRLYKPHECAKLLTIKVNDDHFDVWNWFTNNY